MHLLGTVQVPILPEYESNSRSKTILKAMSTGVVCKTTKGDIDGIAYRRWWQQIKTLVEHFPAA